MHLFSANNIAKYYNDAPLFSNVTFGMESGEKCALVGINGSGKSTLLRIVEGVVLPDEGSIAKNRQLKTAFLAQRPVFSPEDTVTDYLFRARNERTIAIKRYEEACSIGSDTIADLAIEMDRLNAWDYEHEVAAVLDRLNITDLSVKMAELSGGMLKKVALAQVMIADAHLLILDEPTNHLDIETIVWLQERLIETKQAVLMVTHDRYFLDAVCNAIFEIERKKLFYYKGNYSFYLQKQQERHHSEQSGYQRVQTILKKELQWLSRGARARTTKSKERIEKIEQMRSIERIEEAALPDFTITGSRMGKKILEIHAIEKSYNGITVVPPFSYVCKPGERIGIIGPNGSGKTTLLDIIAGIIPPDSGSIDKGVNTIIAYFDQHSRTLPGTMKLLEYVKTGGEIITLREGHTLSASQMLERFLFPSGLHYTPIEKLSGGEQRRLYLLKILMQNPNFIIMDEPTNDFDIKTLSLLEDFLDSFSGNLFIVSHDRYFIDRTVNHLFIFTKNHSIIHYSGTVSEWLNRPVAEKAVKKEKQPKQEHKKENRNGLSYKEKRELLLLEKEIKHLEQEIKEIEKALALPNTSLKQLTELGIKHQTLQSRLDNRTERWFALQELSSE